MSARPKFLFNDDFGYGPSATRGERTLSPTEYKTMLAEAEAEAFRKGFAAGTAQAATDAAQLGARALDRIANGLQDLLGALTELERRIEGEAVAVAVAVARKLAAELIAREPFAEIEALAASCFRQVVGMPHVVVRVDAAAYPTAGERLGEIARRHGYEGRLIVLSDPELEAGDCRIEWADGGIVRDGAKINTVIAETVARYLAARRPASHSMEALP